MARPKYKPYLPHMLEDGAPDSILQHMSKMQLRDARIRLFDMLGEGMTDEEIRLTMSITQSDFEELKYGALKMKGDEYKDKPTEIVFAEYFLQQMGNIHDLSGLIVRIGRFRQQANAVVGAIRARADIMDKIIDRGQEFNIIERKPEERRIVAGVLVANLSNEQLKGAIVRELGNLNKLLKGGSKIEDAILELPNEPMYKMLPSPEQIRPMDPTVLSDNPVVENLHVGIDKKKMMSKRNVTASRKAKSGRHVTRTKVRLEDVPGLGNFGRGSMDNNLIQEQEKGENNEQEG